MSSLLTPIVAQQITADRIRDAAEARLARGAARSRRGTFPSLRIARRFAPARTSPRPTVSRR